MGETTEKDLTTTRLGSLAPECDEAKNKYESCFFEFFPRFLRGDKFEGNDPCSQQLSVYRDCLREHLSSMGVNMAALDEQKLTVGQLAEAIADGKTREVKS